MSSIFHNIFYLPALNALALLVFILPGHSFGLSIIFLTIIVNTILLPLTHKAKHAQRKMQELQPKLEQIKRQHKDNREEQARKQMELYKEHGINPFSSLLLPIVQIPLFLALFKVLQLKGDLFATNLYSFMPVIESPGNMFLGLINLSDVGLKMQFSPQFVFNILNPANVLLALLAAAMQFTQLRMMPRPKIDEKNKESFGVIFQQNLTFTMPVIIFLIGSTLPGALALYWTTMSVFGIVHEGVVRRRAQALTQNNEQRAITTE
ncbi:MAG: YidC/Oxa1 family membrane protein insertase [Patescibacteria group bacterium]